MRNFAIKSQKSKNGYYHYSCKSVQSSLQILDLITSEKRSFEEIAYIIGCNNQTVSQKLNALSEGGIAIDLSETGAIAQAMQSKHKRRVFLRSRQSQKLSRLKPNQEMLNASQLPHQKKNLPAKQNHLLLETNPSLRKLVNSKFKFVEIYCSMPLLRSIFGLSEC